MTKQTPVDPCRHCGGTGTATYPIAEGRFSVDDCYQCRGTGSRVYVAPKAKEPAQ